MARAARGLGPRRRHGRGRGARGGPGRRVGGDRAGDRAGPRPGDARPARPRRPPGLPVTLSGPVQRPARRPGRPGSTASTASCSTWASRPTSSPGRIAGSASRPTARSTCGSTPKRGTTAADLVNDAAARGTGRHLLPVRRGAAQPPDRPPDRRGPHGSSRSARPPGSPTSSARASPASGGRSTRRPGSSRPCGSRVNDELDHLDAALPRPARRCSKPGGRAGDHQLPLAGRPPGQARLPRRPEADRPDEEAGHRDGRGDSIQPPRPEREIEGRRAMSESREPVGSPGAAAEGPDALSRPLVVPAVGFVPLNPAPAEFRDDDRGAPADIPDEDDTADDGDDAPPRSSRLAIVRLALGRRRVRIGVAVGLSIVLLGGAWAANLGRSKSIPTVADALAAAPEPAAEPPSSETAIGDVDPEAPPPARAAAEAPAPDGDSHPPAGGDTHRDAPAARRVGRAAPAARRRPGRFAAGRCRRAARDSAAGPRRRHPPGEHPADELPDLDVPELPDPPATTAPPPDPAAPLELPAAAAIAGMRTPPAARPAPVPPVHERPKPAAPAPAFAEEVPSPVASPPPVEPPPLDLGGTAPPAPAAGDPVEEAPPPAAMPPLDPAPPTSTAAMPTDGDFVPLPNAEPPRWPAGRPRRADRPRRAGELGHHLDAPRGGAHLDRPRGAPRRGGRADPAHGPQRRELLRHRAVLLRLGPVLEGPLGGEPRPRGGPRGAGGGHDDPGPDARGARSFPRQRPAGGPGDGPGLVAPGHHRRQHREGVAAGTGGGPDRGGAGRPPLDAAGPSRPRRRRARGPVGEPHRPAGPLRPPRQRDAPQHRQGTARRRPPRRRSSTSTRTGSTTRTGCRG